MDVSGIVSIVLLAGVFLFMVQRRVNRVRAKVKRATRLFNGKKRQVGHRRRAPQQVPRSRVLNGKCYVEDGDTIYIDGKSIRLFGIDAPEMNHPYGRNAKWAMVKLCKGQRIRAEVLTADHYGRLVARCTLPDGRDLSEELVKQGLAIDWPKFSGGHYRKFETEDARQKLWRAVARQQGRKVD